MKKRVLIVEDEVIFSEHIRLLLQRWGYDITAVATSGEDAIQLLEDECPDLILMDIFLAGELDGIDTARQIHAQYDIPIIYLSACDDDEIPGRLKSSDPSAYILKPVNERELSINLEIALYKHQAKQKLKHLNAVLRTIRKIDKLIVQAKDAGHLLQGVCRTFMALRGYPAIWVAMHEENTVLRLASHAGLGQQAEALERYFADGELPQCAQSALNDTKLVAIDRLHHTCSNCPMQGAHSNKAVMCVPLAYMGKLYGVLNVSIPLQFVEHVEEQILFKELADDIAFALHSIESEKKRREMGAELLAERALLAERVKERTTELSITNARLQDEILERRQAERAMQYAKNSAEAANQAKSEFLANMNHELRTPLNAILGYAQILMNSENLSERQHDGLATIESSGEHLLGLINESLELSKIEAGRMELHEHEFHLPSFLEHLEKIIRIRATQHGIRFVLQQEGTLPLGVRADEHRLREVLSNLLDNGIKYTKEGEVSLIVREIRRHDTSDAISPVPSAVIRFEIHDTGKGIAPEDLEKMFSPFERLQAETAIEGTGLGLTICRKLIEMMGGDLQVDSTSGLGSTFFFDVQMPIVERVHPDEHAYGRRVTGYSGRRRSIMIVDDNPTNRAVLVGLLLPLGFELIEAVNGLECLEKVAKRQSDLIFLDLRMPVLDGFGTTQRLRDMEAHDTLPNADPERPIPIVAVSASVFEETKERAKKIGFSDFCIKPIQQETLQRVLQEHLQIEWTYEDTLPGERRTQDSEPVSIPDSFPHENIAELRSLASRGRIKKLLQSLESLESLDPACRPFVHDIRRLAKQFRVKEIIERLRVGSR